MTESPQTPPSRGRKTLVIAALGAAAVCVLTAGTFVGANISNGQTNRLCTDATTSAEKTAETVKASVETADKARELANGAEGYDKHDGAAALLKTMDNATAGLTESDLAGDCDSREEAKALRDSSKTANAQAGKLDEAAEELNADISAFQAGAKRAAEDKAAADAAEAQTLEEAGNATTGEAAVAEQAAAAQTGAAQVPAPAAQPQYAGGGTAYAPAPQAPSNYAPAPVAPAPYVPAPAPAPAPVSGGSGTGGWTPPPAGSGGGGGCTQIADHVMCSGR
ncbi:MULTISPECIES: hypothetical protein [unclassified Arthrobacter]|uniref:hypothetical protein n=1 Tax=unclassified Arthrobacter TaxID=235627 RepID=UPI001E605A24|nr:MULTISPECIES: hypothetical protein [unclassified Arthrobacter]MCC9145712.1 hypothetical protein [Arthrobacter sp. zg-Y919]MDK1276941.1 hypothetical protein [Arthrobacter sp. zg.Y919]WIB04128.1 hypothetical protein QNO10_05580 [Arthrobacter sp. zg-Y919]